MQLPFNCRSFWNSPRGKVRLTPSLLFRNLTPSRIKRYKDFKEFKHRICVATDVFGRGIDIEKINLAINYDLPKDADSYLHRVGRAGRFGTKGISISFISSEEDETVLEETQKRFKDVKIMEYPAEGIDSKTYMSR